MISQRVFIVTLVLAVKLVHVRAANAWTSPMAFHYKQDEPYDLINVNIILENVPVEADRYLLYYQTENCDKDATGPHSPPGCDVPPVINTIPANRTITIMRILNKKSVRIYIELKKKINKFCATKIIVDGIRDPYAYVNTNQFRKDCLNKQWSLCEITVDFGNKCEEHSRAKLYCSQRARVTCEVTDQELPEDTVHQWYQEYRDGSFIGTIPTVKGNKTEFKMTFYKFDSNTYVFSVMNSARFAESLLSEESKVPFPSNAYYENFEFTTKKYTENEQVNFTCSNNAPTQVGVIEPTGYKISTFNLTTYSWKPTKAHNGSMFCCVNYLKYPDVNKKTVVERIITDLTVLIYEESINQKNIVNTANIPLSISSTSLPESTNRGITSRVTAPQQNTPAATSDSQPRAEATPPSGFTDQDTKTNYYIAAAAVAGIILLTSLIYIVIKRCSRKLSDPEQTLQLETYASTNKVLYAELDIRPSTRPAPASTEDTTYAEIIGVLRPPNEQANK